MIELENGKDITLRQVWLPGGNRLEVFTYEGIDYVRGEPADIAVRVPKAGVTVLLRRRDTIVSANALCSIHKTYRAIRKPRTNCGQCWDAYHAKTGK